MVMIILRTLKKSVDKGIPSLTFSLFLSFLPLALIKHRHFFLSVILKAPHLNSTYKEITWYQKLRDDLAASGSHQFQYKLLSFRLKVSEADLGTVEHVNVCAGKHRGSVFQT